MQGHRQDPDVYVEIDAEAWARALSELMPEYDRMKDALREIAFRYGCQCFAGSTSPACVAAKALGILGWSCQADESSSVVP